MYAQRRAYKVLGEISFHFQWARFCANAALLFILSAAPLTPVLAQDSKPAIAPPSKWVIPIRSDAPFNLDPPDPSASLRWVLVERQINAKNDEQFFHWVCQVLTPAGVLKASRIAIEFDPSYESLTMHWVKIWRGTNVLNGLDPSRFQTSQSPLDAADFLLSTARPATLLLDDIHPGDIIDYAYSIEGSNPALNGMFADRVRVQLEDPVDHLVTRLLWPPPRKVYVQNHGTEIYPTTVYWSNMVVFAWDATKVPGLRLQPQIPIWYDPYPWVQLSEYQTWSDVNKWALKLFATSNTFSPDLTQKIKEWKQLSGQEDRALAALQFVQEEIRYTALGDGTSGYQPASPSEIFARRFGDCKDKTSLLVAMLRALNIDAYPVLVNSRARQTVADLHPSPVVFNHAVVQATVNNRYYYLDSTAAYERGPLADRSWPDYRFGLLIRPGVTALWEIPPCTVLPKTTVTAYFSIGDLNEPTGLRIVTVAEGTDAEALREHFSTTSQDDIEREYYSVQAKYYTDIRSTAPLQFSDDQQNNRFQITEFYSVPRMWNRLPEEAYYHCHFYSVNVDDAMRKPDVSPRTMPLGIDYPVDQVSRIEASWTTGWPVHPDNESVMNPAFSFYRNETFIGTNLVIEHEYRSLTDVVMPDAVPTYLRQLDAAMEFLGCTVVSY